MSRLMALIDCNNFFVSCETVFKPWLRGKPAIVLSNNDGCVIARSQEAKDCGIPMGAPYHLYKKQLDAHNAATFSSNFSLYGEFSRRIHHILSRYCDEIEVYSIDESFFMIPHYHTAERNDDATQKAIEAKAYKLARTIQATIQQWLNIPTSVGIATTKSLAKIANKLAKKNHSTTGGIYNLGFSQAPETLLKSLAVEELWGISYKSKKKLNSHKIYTALDFYHASPHLIRSLLSITGERIYYELRGEPCLTIDMAQASKKSIQVSRSFGTTITEKVDIQSALTDFVSRAAEKLRTQNSRSYAMYVYLRTSFHHDHPRYMRGEIAYFEEALYDTNILVGYSRILLDSLFIQGYRYAKVGVTLMNIVDASPYQKSLFKTSHQEQNKALMETIDKINAKYENHTVFVASRGVQSEKKWSSRTNFGSPRYLTRWDELLVVHAT